MAKLKKAMSSTIPSERILGKIHVIRGQKVMLDFDIAVLYEVETKRLNEQVKRNIDRFPDDFMFRLSSEEWQQMRSQFATASQSKRNTAITPFAFTEQGVAMLSGVVHSTRAIEMNIAIMRAFVETRKLLHGNKMVSEQIQQLFDRIGEHDVQLSAIYDALENLMDTKAEETAKSVSWEERERIGFKK